MSISRHLCIAVMTLAVAFSLAGCGSDDSAKSEEEQVMLAQGSDPLPSRTAAEWATFAEHVVVATVTSDREIPPFPEEIEAGEGLIGRRVELRVDDVIWSRENVDRPPPARLDYSASGWVFDGTPDNRRKMGGADTSRLEVGHTYILALWWSEARCAPGDGREAAHWRPLGAGGVVPFDDQTIGVGEHEGRLLTLDGARKVARELPSGEFLKFQLVGRSSQDLVAELRRATPTGETKADYRVPAPCD